MIIWVLPLAVFITIVPLRRHWLTICSFIYDCSIACASVGGCVSGDTKYDNSLEDINNFNSSLASGCISTRLAIGR